MTKPINVPSSGRDDYETPWPIIHWLEARFGKFCLDPCCYRHTKKAPRYMTAAGNALIKDWFGNIFMNPPWSQPLQSLFVAKASMSVALKTADQVVGLIPSCNMDTHAWHDCILNYGAHEVIVVRGRVHFGLDGQPTENGSVPICFPVWQQSKRPKTPRLYAVDIKELMKGG